MHEVSSGVPFSPRFVECAEFSQSERAQAPPSRLVVKSYKMIR